MSKKKLEEVSQEKLTKIEVDFQRDDLNQLRDLVNGLTDRVNNLLVEEP